MPDLTHPPVPNPPGPDSELESLVTKLAPLYKERTVLQGELGRVTARLEKINAEIAEMEGRLRPRETH